MRKFRSSKSGQFVILAAVIMAAFMFSLVLTVSRMNLSRQKLDYEPIDEVVLAITSDFERCLARSLARATMTYAESGGINSAITSGEEVIQEWFRAILESYKGFGINVILSAEPAARNIDWIINWGEWEGRSYVYTTFSININAYGLKGLALTMQRVVYLKVLNVVSDLNLDEDKAAITIRFMVTQGGRGRDEPVQDFTLNNIKILVDGNEIDSKDILGLKYLGRGVYRLQFNYNSRLMEKIVLVVITREGIRVEAKLRSCTICLRSEDASTPETMYDNKGEFNLIIDGAQYTRNPPYYLSLFPNQTLTVSFTPPDKSTFIDFSVDHPLTKIMQAGSIVTVKVLEGGSGTITAWYSTYISPDQAHRYYLNLTSIEEDEETSNLGTIGLRGVNYTLPAVMINVTESYGQNLQVTYYPYYGYAFSKWKCIGSILIENSSSQSTKITIFGNGTLIAYYKKQRPAEWQFLYISPERGVGRDKNFTLLLEPIEGHVAPPLNNPFDKRNGTSPETPTLYLGRKVDIILYAFYSKNKESIDVRITLGFYDKHGAFYEIGSKRITIVGSDKSGGTYNPYELSFSTSGLGDPPVIPEGSRIVLILERLDQDDGGTLQIQSGRNKSKITLW